MTHKNRWLLQTPLTPEADAESRTLPFRESDAFLGHHHKPIG